MATTTRPATAWSNQLAILLAYPEAGHAARAAALRSEVAAFAPAAAAALDRHLAQVSALPPEALEELYTRTFDLQPVCAPYLSVHLFGEESPQRAALMTGLAGAWGELGAATGGELPDHVAVVLANGPRLPGGQWDELVRFALRPALERMIRALDGAGSPYGALCEAGARLLEDAPHV